MFDPNLAGLDPSVPETPADVTEISQQFWLTDFLSGVIEPALTLAAIGLVWSVFAGVRGIYRRTWGSRRQLTKRIDNLGVGVSEKTRS